VTADAPEGPSEGLLDELSWRGILHAATPGLAARLADGRPIAGYNGFDPSGASLHVGHLIPIFGLLRLQRHGGRPVALVGGGTGMIGDPSGRSAERNLLDRDTLAANVVALREQLGRFLDFSPGSGGAVMVNNLDWLGELSLIDFLRDTGKHFTIPYMLAKDSVQSRLERGLSFTEFSYMLLQSYDFWHLHKTMGVELQMGGADQWGNITAGLELIRRRAGVDEAADEQPAHGLSYKLLLSPSGQKFGKSETGDSVWLDAARTTPFAFYQYWLNTDDRDVGTYLRWFTELPRGEIEALDAAVVDRPEAREAQRALARDITVRTHGQAVADAAIRDAEALFSPSPILHLESYETLHAATGGLFVSSDAVAHGSNTILTAAGLVSSKGEGRRLVNGGGVTINGHRITEPDEVVEPVGDRWLDVRLGKRRRHIIRVD
jgi:tyrosyl-tRNA synthetase